MRKSFLLMIIAALLYSICTPLTKVLLGDLSPIFLSGLTYLGGAIGMAIIFLIMRLTKKDKEELLKGKDFIFVLIINIVDTCGCFLLFYGISLINSDEASLLQSFEVVSTALIAYFVFKEKISWRLLLAILFLLAGSVFLSIDFSSTITFEPGALYVLLGVALFGISNNVIKLISTKDSLEFTVFKCLVPGVILVLISVITGNYKLNWPYIGYGLLGGFFSFGVSIAFYAFALRKLSAAMGTTVFSSNPFFASIISLIVFQNVPKWNFYVSLLLLLIGEGFAAYDNFVNEKIEREKSREKILDNNNAKENVPK